MKKRINKTSVKLWIMTAVVSIAAESAFAGIAVSPMQQWVTVKPGQEASFTVSVTNTLREQQTSSQAIVVEAVDFEIAPEGGISFGKEFAHPRSALKLITLADGDGKFVLEPGQSRQIKAKVSAPLNADGDYWGAIMIKIANPQKDEKGVTVNLQTASGIFIHVPRKNSTEKGSVIRTDILLPDLAAESDPNLKGDDSEKSALRVAAQLKNDGVVTFLGEGKAYLYAGKMKRFASISLHTPRRQIFPGQSRIFTGVLSDPVSAGTYKMRVVFSAVSQNNDGDIARGRTITRDFDFTVSPELAQQWSKKNSTAKPEQLKFGPKELKLTAAAGRFTTVSVLVENIGVSTVTLKSQFSRTAVKDWFSSESDLTTFGPNMKRNIVFSLNIPRDVEPGDYSGTLILEAQRSGIHAQDVTEKMTIPVSIKIT